MARRFLASLLIAALSTLGAAGADAKPKKKKPAPAAHKVGKPNAEQKKAMLELLGAYKFGMSKDEIIATLTKQIDENYAEKIAQTSDIALQDRLRKEKKEKIKEASGTYVEFNGKKSGWDVSIIDTEFAHGTGESMLSYWDTQGDKNQRRYFFFVDGRLYKTLLQFDTKQINEEQRTFDFFKKYTEGRYGAAKVEPGKLSWGADGFQVRASDKIQFYDAFCLVIEDLKMANAVAETRLAKAPSKDTGPKILDSVLEGKDGATNTTLDQNKDAVNAIINGK